MLAARISAALLVWLFKNKSVPLVQRRMHII